MLAVLLLCGALVFAYRSEEVKSYFWRNACGIIALISFEIGMLTTVYLFFEMNDLMAASVFIGLCISTLFNTLKVPISNPNATLLNFEPFALSIAIFGVFLSLIASNGPITFSQTLEIVAILAFVACGTQTKLENRRWYFARALFYISISALCYHHEFDMLFSWFLIFTIVVIVRPMIYAFYKPKPHLRIVRSAISRSAGN